MIKALHICQRDEPATGGSARVAVELVKRLPKHGIAAKCLFVYGTPGQFGKELEGRCDYLGLQSSAQALLHARRLRRFLKAERPAIIHHHDGLTWTHWISRNTPGAIRYGHAHLDPPPPTAPFRHRLANLLNRRIYDHLVCVSEATHENWISSGFPTDKSETIRNGVDTTLFRQGTRVERIASRKFFRLPADAHVIAFVGRLHNAMKGPDDFLRILALLPMGFHGLIAGVGPDEPLLRALAVDLGISNRVVFAGSLATPIKSYHAADVLVMTSHYEPFGLVVLEATACGIPVAGFSARGGVMELLHRLDAIIVKHRNCRELADAVIRLVDETERQTLRFSRRALIEKEYSWDQSALLLAQSYSRALRRIP